MMQPIQEIESIFNPRNLDGDCDYIAHQEGGIKLKNSYLHEIP